MKKIFYSIFALSTLLFTATSCTEDKGTSTEVSYSNNDESVNPNHIRPFQDVPGETPKSSKSKNDNDAGINGNAGASTGGHATGSGSTSGAGTEISRNPVNSGNTSGSGTTGGGGTTSGGNTTGGGSATGGTTGGSGNQSNNQ